MRTLLFALLTLLVFQDRVSAAFVIRIGNGEGLSNPIQAFAGDAVAIPVYGFFNTPAEATNLQVEGFNLAFDFGADNVGTTKIVNPNVFVFADPPASTTSFSTSGVTVGGGYSSFIEGNAPSASANWDRRFVASFSNPASFTTTPTRLFDLTFTAGSELGVFGINVVGSPTSPPNGTRITVNANPYTFGLEQGSFQITAVPEPSSMLVLAGLVAGGGYRQWRRKKQQALSATSA